VVRHGLGEEGIRAKRERIGVGPRAKAGGQEGTLVLGGTKEW
jgi:hypothetical protein